MDYSDAYELAEEFIDTFLVDDGDDIYIPADKDHMVLGTVETFLKSKDVDSKTAAEVACDLVSLYQDPVYGR